MDSKRAVELTFVTTVRSREERRRLQMLIDSLRTFGGPWKDSRVLVFDISPEGDLCGRMAVEKIDAVPLHIPEPLASYPFGGKAAACARAEERLSGPGQVLVWASVDCLIVNPPAGYALQPPVRIALRPVHIQNVGSPVDQALDGYWQRIYDGVGLEEAPFSVVSFVDRVKLRPYFNTHVFAVDPSLGLMGRWQSLFRALISEGDFQKGPCRPSLKKVFLHQALLSSLVVRELAQDEIRFLSPAYGYPYNLQDQIPAGDLVENLGDLVSLTWEGRSLDPERVEDIRLGKKYHAWLARYRS